MTYFRQIYDEGLAQAAYILGDPESRRAVVVDPLRDIDIYLDRAADAGYDITGVVETHIHADFLSGGRELATATGARLYVSAETTSGWEYGGLDGLDTVELSDGETIAVGDIELQALHTPGHTPEHLSFLVSGGDGEPRMVLTGDFVFVGDLGRPDLLEEAAGQADTAEPGAREAFRTLTSGFLELPDHVAIWPGHGAGTACGKAPGDVPSSTIGFERGTAWWGPYFQSGDENGFVEEFLSDQPETPTYYGTMKELNRDGPSILGELPSPARLGPGRFADLVDDDRAVVFDLRDVRSFAAGRIPGSINLSSLSGLSNHAGWLAPYDRQLVLIADPRDVEEATRRLIRIGLDDIAGFVPVGRIRQYAPGDLTGYPVFSDADTARALMQREEANVLDVRSAAEYERGHIPGAEHAHYGRIPKLLADDALDMPFGDETTVVHCEAGTRAAVATSVLEADGAENVVLYTGGFGDWKEAGHPVEKSD